MDMHMKERKATKIVENKSRNVYSSVYKKVFKCDLWGFVPFTVFIFTEESSSLSSLVFPCYHHSTTVPYSSVTDL
jgi:hypothetical protein